MVVPPVSYGLFRLQVVIKMSFEEAHTLVDGEGAAALLAYSGELDGKNFVFGFH